MVQERGTNNCRIVAYCVNVTHARSHMKDVRQAFVREVGWLKIVSRPQFPRVFVLCCNALR